MAGWKDGHSCELPITDQNGRPFQKWTPEAGNGRWEKMATLWLEQQVLETPTQG